MDRLFRLVVALTLVALLAAFRAPSGDRYGGLDTPVPDLELQTVEGRPARLFGTEPGWTLLKFGTTWCPQCEEEVAELNRIAEALRQREVRVVEVFLRETPDTVGADLRNLPRAYAPQVVVDRAGETIPLYGLRVIPRLVLVDPGGIARADSRFQKAEDLLAAIDRAMARVQGNR